MKPCLSFFPLLLLLLVNIPLHAQPPEVTISWLTEIPGGTNNILYNSSRKLSIDDFKGEPDKTSDAVAITSSGFMFTAKFHSKGNIATLNIGVYCSFNKDESWMKESGKNAYILGHEQRHFDISYLNALQFVKKVRATEFNREGYMEQLKSVYRQVADEMRAMQNKYDTETINGINKEKQAEWDTKIDKLLNSAGS